MRNLNTESEPIENREAPTLIDLNIAYDFISALTGSPDAPVTFQTFDDTGAKRKSLARVYHGSLAYHERALRKANDVGAGVFITVNKTDGAGRAAKNIVALRALFVDSDDGALPDLLPLQESIRVRSARGEHAYWLLQEGQELAKFTPAQKALIAALHTDESIHDRSRVMRLPGFLHRKGSPFLVTHTVTDAPRRSIEEVLGALPEQAQDVTSEQRKRDAPPPTDPLAMAAGDPWEGIDTEVVIARARKYLANVPAAIEGQGGDRQTFKAACGLVRDFALSDDVALQLLSEWNNQCEPPWNWEDLRLKIENARRYGTHDSGQLRDAPQPRLVPVTHDGRSIAANDDQQMLVDGVMNDDRENAPYDDIDGDLYLEALLAMEGEPPRTVEPDAPKYEHIKVRDALTDADISAALLVPYGYKLSQKKGRGVMLDGATLAKRKKKGKANASTNIDKGDESAESGQDKEGAVDVPIAGFPVIIKTRLVDSNDGQVRYELACMVGKKWFTHVVERERALSTRHITELAAYDFPVNSTNAYQLVQYLAAFDDENRWAIPTRSCTEQMGWHKSGDAHVFVAGDTCYVPGAKVAPVAFVHSSNGDAHLSKCFRTAGTLEGQLEGLRLAAKYPRVELSIYAALAAPLMHLVGAPSFAIDWCGESSTGKTTTMKIAVSMWGEPNERARYGLMHSWNTTQVGLERLASSLNDLPLFMDETKQAPTGPKGRCIVPECIYQVTNGQGRARGAVQGRRKTLYWNTLLLTTGERPAVDHSKDAGPAARTLTLWGSPFGGYSDDVPKIEAFLMDNYGHIGPLFVQWLVENRAANQERWRKLYGQICFQLKANLQERLEGNVTSRLAKYLAVLDLTDRLLREAIAIPWPQISCVDAVLESVAKNAAPFDRPLEALKHCFSVAVAEKATFYHCHDGNKPPPRFNGYWRTTPKDGPGGRYDDWEFIGFLPDYLERILRAAGYDVAPTLKLWSERGWLMMQRDRSTRVVRINGEGARVYALKREAVQAAIG